MQLKVKAWPLLLLLLFLNSNCWAESVPRTYELIPERRSTGSFPQFQLIDDFNSGIGWNHLKTYWETNANPGSSVNLIASTEDALTSWGKSATLDYVFAPGGSVEFSALLGNLDMSQAEAVVMLVRDQDMIEFPGSVSVRLQDALGQSGAVDVRMHIRERRSKATKKGWVEVYLPISAFGALDANQLTTLELGLQSETGVTGEFSLDEVAFFGAGDVVFESDRDNLVGFPEHSEVPERRETLLATKDNSEFLREIAKDTWLYFDNLIDKNTWLAVDHARVGRHKGVGSYTSPTNIALQWLSIVAAYDLSFITKDEALEQTRKSFDVVLSLERWKDGFWYNFYDTRDLSVTRKYVSTVDNGWLAAALVVLRAAFPKAFGEEATELLQKMDFSELFDPVQGQLRIGYDAATDKPSHSHYGLLATEARIASYIAIGKGDVDTEHWTKIYRTLPADWDWQRQQPGEEGHYTYLDRKFVPSWGGSLFEFLAPFLLVDEQSYARSSLAKNNKMATDFHIGYALRKQQYPIWGLSPCAIENGRGWSYREYGIPDLGSKGYPDAGIVAPYASILALEIRPDLVIRNLRKMLEKFPGIYGEYGFYDSVHAVKGTVNPQYLVLDQAMSFLALANYLEGGAIRNLFHADPIGEAVKALLGEETFSME